MTESETEVQAHNRRQTEAIGKYVEDLDDAILMVKRAGYKIWSEKEDKKRQRSIRIILVILVGLSLFTGFAICMAIGGSNCVGL